MKKGKVQIKLFSLLIFEIKLVLKKKKNTHEKPPGGPVTAHGEVLEFRFRDSVPGRPNSEKGMS